MAGGHHARREVHVGADVTLVGHGRLARVESNAHSDRPVVERPLRSLSRGERIGGACEGVEEGVALCVHLDPAVAAEGVAQRAPVLR